MDDATKMHALEELRVCPMLVRACRLVGVSMTTLRKARKEDEDFDAKVKEALGDGYGTLEDEAFRRAVEGVDEPVFHKGKICGYVTKYSDKLLGDMLAARKPAYNKKLSGEIHADKEGVTFQFNYPQKEEGEE